MSLARVQFFSISLDGFGTGEGQSLETPFGHAGERLHEWMFVTRWWRQLVGEPGGSAGVDDAFLRLHDPGIGAEIMGAGSSARPVGPRTRSGRAGGVATRRSTHRPSSSPITRARRSRWRAARPSTFRRFAGRALNVPRGRRRSRRSPRRGGHDGSRVPCRPAGRSHAHRGGPDPARPRRAPLGRARRPPRARHRDHRRAERRDTRDVPTCGSLNRLGIMSSELGIDVARLRGMRQVTLRGWTIRSSRFSESPRS